jgi:predicted DNA-binding transcriptional regulator AlpA
VSLKALLDLIAAKPLLTRKNLAQRYGKTLWTIDRWHRDRVLPSPRYLRGCAFPFWRPCDIEAAEKKQPQLKRALKK